MQQRRLRLGDILDDYCPRERRITNHAVVAMIDDEVKQTRCTTCDADHEYKQARVPASRRRSSEATLGPDGPEGMLRPRVPQEPPPAFEEAAPAPPPVDAVAEESPATDAPVVAEPPESEAPPEAADAPDAPEAPDDEDGPVHRRLIRATLPRPEGQSPERRSPDFTIRQMGGRAGREMDGKRNGHRQGQGQGRRPVRAQGGSHGESSRFGNPHHGQGQRSGGNRQGPQGGQRGNRPGHGPGGRGGRKRGR